MPYEQNNTVVIEPSREAARKSKKDPLVEARP
jgi:hypothetical protein